MAERFKGALSMTDFLESRLRHKTRFFLGILLIVPWVLQDQPLIKTGLFFLLAALTRLSGKKLKWGYFLVLIASISFFHLLSPSGRLLFKIGQFPVTLGALSMGYMKALTLIGLVFISLSSVKAGLQFPGKMGGMLAKTLFYFEEIMRSRQSLKPGQIIPRLDEALMDLDHAEERSNPGVQSSTTWALCLGIILNILFYGLFLFTKRFY